MTPSPVKAAIKPAELERVDIRVGTIVEVRDVPGADRLVELIVGFGVPVLAIPEYRVPDGTRA